MKNISVSDDVHKQLIQLRNQFGFKHQSKTIEKLIESYQPTPKKIDALPKSTEQSIEEKVGAKLSEKDQTIRYALITLMKQHPHKVWLIPELVHKAIDTLDMNYQKAKEYVELLLSKISEIEKADGFKIGDELGYRLIE